MITCPFCIVLWESTAMHGPLQGVDWEEASDLKAVAAEVDVLYQTRIQKERFQVIDACHMHSRAWSLRDTLHPHAQSSTLRQHVIGTNRQACS